MDPLPTNPIVPVTTSSRPISSGPGDLRRQSTRHFSGMIKCNPQETERITDAVIIGAFSPLSLSLRSGKSNSRSNLELKPRLAAKYIPGLPAYILFMCIRYIDFVDDEAHVAGFLSAVTKKIKKLPRVTFRSIRSIEETRLLFCRETKISTIRSFGRRTPSDFSILSSSTVAKR